MTLRAADVAALVASLALYVLLLRINVPVISAVRRTRRSFEPGRLTLELPVALTISVVYGPAVTAALTLIAYALALPADGRSKLGRRLLDGGSESCYWLAAGAAANLLVPFAHQPAAAGGLAIVAIYTALFYAFSAAIWLPLRAAQTGMALARLYRTQVRDTRLAGSVVLLAAWGCVCTAIWARAGIALGLASFAPLPAMAAALRALHNQRLDLHRLRLARDAVQAMLGARDPLPQMNSLLSSLHTPSADETLQICAALAPDGDRLTPLASIGPAPDAILFEACRRAVLELHHAQRPSATARSGGFTVTAYAVRSTGDELLGALLVLRPARTASMLPARRFAKAAAELAPLLRDFRAIAATQNAASHDALTGLSNRRTIMEHLRERVERVSLAGPCAVLLLDIDRFKTINDTLGHQAGDHCLRTVAGILNQNVRSLDRAGRIGGEEFVIVMPDTTSEMALAVGERLRKQIEETGVRHAGGEPVTVSIGVAVASLRDTVDSLMARADRALYQAKREGRNRVVEVGA